MNITLKISGFSLLFLLIIITGVILARAGKPYHPVLFNVHKLASIAGAVVAGIFVYNQLQNIESNSLLFTLSILTGLVFLGLIVSGGLLNLDKSFFNILQVLHRVSSGVGIILSIVLFYLLLSR